MRVTPRTEADLAEEKLWDIKISYGFQVLEATDQVSKSGNEMIKLKLLVFTDTGRERIMYDYLLDAMAHKVRHAAAATGLLASYEAEELQAHEFVGKTGSLKLGRRVNQQTGLPENTVVDYVYEKDAPQVVKPTVALPLSEDEIPF
jgi:hypothetical protein